MSENNLDEVFFHVLSECVTLPNFLDAVFGFLKRKTDFYMVSDAPNAPLGLPPKFAENLVRHTFSKWEKLEAAPMLTPVEAPPPIEEVEITDACTSDDGQEDMAISLAEKPSSNSSEASSFNGAVIGDRMWAQSIKELDITIHLDPDVLSKHLLVQFSSKRILVRNMAKSVDIFVGDLPHPVKHTEALWMVTSNRLEIHLEKIQERWWDRLAVGDAPLDVNKLDCSRPLDELTEEARAKIEELHFNKAREREGLPTTQQMRLEETLRQAWNAEGSPFSGPFDPSKVIM